ncbi:MAG: hypothetical protein ABS40_12180 [Agrobacterium sp. SCN 61-19]|nr:MAG: hypothetical protein ABS40_12180 [Agrobacterium sp. SCN 61-19]
MPTTAAGAATDRQRVAAARRRSRPLTEARIASIDTKRGREMQTTKDPFSHGSIRAKAGGCGQPGQGGATSAGRFNLSVSLSLSDQSVRYSLPPIVTFQ